MDGMNIFSQWKILAVGPHPDDVDLGCAGIIMKAHKTLGVIVTQSEDFILRAQRNKEAEKAAEELEYSLEFLGLKENEATNIEVINKIAEVLARSSIDVVLVPWPKDTHQDHRTVSQAVQTACRRFPGWIIYYNLPSSEDFVPNLIVEMSPSEYKRKSKALQCHASQRMKPYMDQRALDTLFHFWGWFYKRNGVPCEAYHIKKARVK